MAESQAIVCCRAMNSVMLSNIIWYRSNHTIYWLIKTTNFEQVKIKNTQVCIGYIQYRSSSPILGQRYVTQPEGMSHWKKKHDWFLWWLFRSCLEMKDERWDWGRQTKSQNSVFYQTRPFWEELGDTLFKVLIICEKYPTKIFFNYFILVPWLKHSLETKGQDQKEPANMRSKGWWLATGRPRHKKIFKWSCILEEKRQFMLI